jgi:hypothetical protein
VVAGRKQQGEAPKQQAAVAAQQSQPKKQQGDKQQQQQQQQQAKQQAKQQAASKKEQQAAQRAAQQQGKGGQAPPPQSPKPLVRTAVVARSPRPTKGAAAAAPATPAPTAGPAKSAASVAAAGPAAGAAAPAPAPAPPGGPWKQQPLSYAQKLREAASSSQQHPQANGVRIAPAPKAAAGPTAPQDPPPHTAAGAPPAAPSPASDQPQPAQPQPPPPARGAGGGGAGRQTVPAKMIAAWRSGVQLPGLLKQLAAERPDLSTALNERVRSWLTQDCDRTTAEALAVYVLSNMRRDWGATAKTPGAFLMGLLQHRAQLLQGGGLAGKLLDLARAQPNVAEYVDSDAIQELGEMEPQLRGFVLQEYVAKQRRCAPEGMCSRARLCRCVCVCVCVCVRVCVCA